MLLKLLRRTANPKGLADRSTSFAWLTYKAIHGGELLRVFNTTDKPVDQSITVKAKPFMLVDVGRQQRHYKPGPGDVFMRQLSAEELRQVVEIRVKAEEKGTPFKLKPREQRRADHRRELSTALIVDQVPGSLLKKA